MVIIKLINQGKQQELLWLANRRWVTQNKN